MNNIAIEVARGEIGENFHRAHICIINKDREIIKKYGNENFLTFFSSSQQLLKKIPYYAKFSS